jgi:DNA-binding transcriptional MocR family regulator
VPVIDDCTLADLSLEGSAPQPIAAYAPNAPLITLGTLSKSIGPGFRVGWARAPEPVIERLARIKTASDLSSPLLTQAIGARLLGAMDEVRRLRRVQLKPRRDLLAALLREQLPEWKFRVPSGGLFLWVELPHGDTREYAQTALRHGVLVLAGPVMSAAEQQTAFLRLPFLGDPETLRTGVRRLAAAWREYRSEPRERRQGVAII